MGSWMICDPEEGEMRQPLGWSIGGEMSPVGRERSWTQTASALTGCLKFLLQKFTTTSNNFPLTNFASLAEFVVCNCESHFNCVLNKV